MRFDEKSIEIRWMHEVSGSDCYLLRGEGVSPDICVRSLVPAIPWYINVLQRNKSS